MCQPFKFGVQFRGVEGREQLHPHGEATAPEQIRVGDHPDRHPRLHDGDGAVALAQHQLDHLAKGCLRGNEDNLARHDVRGVQRRRHVPNRIGAAECDLGILDGDQTTLDHLLDARK